MSKLLLLGVILLITGTVARADAVCPTTATLANYIALGSCTIPYTTFPPGSQAPSNYNATLSGFGYTPGSGAPPASQITVTLGITVYNFACPFNDTTTCVEVAVGFGGFSTTTSLSGSLDYSVNSGTGPFYWADLLLSGVVPSGASVAAQAALSNGVSLSTEIVNLPPPAGVDHPDSGFVWFPGAPLVLSVQDSFTANAGPSGSPTSFGFTNTFVTPEPATLILMGWGLVGLLAAARKLHAPRA
ncbi:MAG: PEP-CTERM sorting domain-containing protein [Candidatus Acidiferrales bacterium]